MNKFVLFLASVIAQLGWLIAAHAEPFQDIPHEILRVPSTDEVELSVFHLEPLRPGSPVVLLEPGLIETAAMLEGVATAFRNRGYDVYIGQVRLAGRGDDRSGSGDRNRLEDVLLRDFPSHLRYVIRRHPDAKISLFGHSMGGMEIMAALSDRALSEEFSPHVKAVSLVAAPQDLLDVPWVLRAQCKAMLPLYKSVVRFLGPSFDAHNSLLDFMQRVQDSPNPLVAQAAGALQGWFIKFGSFVLTQSLVSTNHTSPEALKRLWLEQVSPLPLEVLIDFAAAAATGEFIARDGHRLIVPSRITVPTQVIRATRDKLVTPESQFRLLQGLGSRIKRLVDLQGMQHVDPVVADRPGSDFLGAAVDFHDNPGEAARQAPRLLFRAGMLECERFLRLPLSAPELQFQ